MAMRRTPTAAAAVKKGMQSCWDHLEDDKRAGDEIMSIRRERKSMMMVMMMLLVVVAATTTLTMIMMMMTIP